MGPFGKIDEGLRLQIRKFTIIFVIAATIIYVAFILSEIPSEVGTLYYRYAELMLDLQMPYSDFDAEYPPFAMVLILIPGLFSFSSLSYQIIFGIEVYLFLLMGLICIHKIAGTYSNNPNRFSNLYIILSICLFDFIIDRYDIFPMVMCLMALYFIRFDMMKSAWAMIALGTITKLYPALMAPILLIFLCTKGRKTDALKGIGICLVIGGFSMLPFLISDPTTAFMFLTYHMERGMQVESLASSFLMLFGYLDIIDIGYVFNFGSDNIYGVIPDAVAGCMLYIMLTAILLTYIGYWYIVRKNRMVNDYFTLTATCLTVIMLFMMVNKVLSSQYLIWMIPFVIIVTMNIEHKWEKWIIGTFCTSIALTQINLIVNYALRPVGEPFTLSGIILILVRNIILVMIFVTIVRMMLGSEGMVSDRKI